QAEEDSLLKIAKAKNQEMMARRKHVQDSLTALENQKAQTLADNRKATEEARRDSIKTVALIKKQELERAKREQQEQDSLLRVAEARNKE
ncbi:hypothetical protein, partial [Klebsiella pneumoniae]|uniref:hypothetical protein n=1 Tax=Klebsiella pneumoniae TaxID=573 RepID=UPI003EE2843F